MRAKHYIVTNYWLAFYQNGHCTLCGNSGVIDTRDTAITGAKWNVGRLNWCICPNGQVLRNNSKGKSPNEVRD